jgi:hypothetical protein
MMTAPTLAARTAPTCRYSSKRSYGTRQQARDGARLIRAEVEYRGGRYQTLYPYKCPDLHHWHLSHYQQGFQTCPHCGCRTPAWRTDLGTWVISRHNSCDAYRILGEGEPV